MLLCIIKLLPTIPAKKWLLGPVTYLARSPSGARVYVVLLNVFYSKPRKYIGSREEIMIEMYRTKS